ncbi:hypothetical protein Tsubulata_046316, partial [Turnera subulata]
LHRSIRRPAVSRRNEKSILQDSLSKTGRTSRYLVFVALNSQGHGLLQSWRNRSIWSCNSL